MKSENNTPQRKETDLLLKKWAMVSAWVLLAGIFVLIISGWGITQTGIIYRLTFGLVDRRLADTIHRAANTPVVFFFLTHVLINIKLVVLRRHPSSGWLANTILIIVGALLMLITIYMGYIRPGG
jgi:thiosulfate reductase cytochrome b subunit